MGFNLAQKSALTALIFAHYRKIVPETGHEDKRQGDDHPHQYANACQGFEVEARQCVGSRQREGEDEYPHTRTGGNARISVTLGNEAGRTDAHAYGQRRQPES